MDLVFPYAKKVDFFRLLVETKFFFNGLLYQNVRLMAETNVNRWTGMTMISQTYSEAQWYECSTLEREIN